MIWTSHPALDLREAYELSKRDLRSRIATITGRHLRWWQVRDLLREAEEQRYLVLPLCDKVDTRGFCTGHQIPSLGEEELVDGDL